MEGQKVLHLHTKLLGVLHGGIPRIWFCKGQLANVKATLPLRTLEGWWVRPNTNKLEGQRQVARVKNNAQLAQFVCLRKLIEV